MEEIALCLVTAAVFVFGFFLTIRFGRLLDEAFLNKGKSEGIRRLFRKTGFGKRNRQ